jgi:hypothetical protein
VGAYPGKWIPPIAVATIAQPAAFLLKENHGRREIEPNLWFGLLGRFAGPHSG